MHFCLNIILLAFLLLTISCSGTTEPATPTKTFKTYILAAKEKDTTTMKLLLSSETLKMHELEAKAQNITLDDLVKNETLFTEGQKTIEYRNEKIDGDRATLEMKTSFGTWETVPFVFEGSEWKIDKKGYRDELMKDIETQTDEQLDNLINETPEPLGNSELRATPLSNSSE
ncbi:MAG: hypothetical protein WBD22_07485 [Pyrinomonadaceae bacterium]